MVVGVLPSVPKDRNEMILQLDPPIPMVTPKGKGFANLVIDYGPEHDLLWTVFVDETGECWTFPNKEVRMQDNITLGRRTNAEAIVSAIRH